MRKHWILALSCAGGLLFLSGTASAAETFSTRFGPIETHVVIGVVDGKVTVIEQRVSDGQCASQVFSDEPHLNDYIDFFAGDGPNIIRFDAGYWDYPDRTFCGVNITPIQIVKGHPYQVVIRAGAGDDLIFADSTALVWAGDGNDVALSYDSDGLVGDAGNDYMIEGGSEGVGYLEGGAGDDQLCDTANGSFERGGPGTDLVWNASGGDTYEGVMSSPQSCYDTANWALLQAP